MLERILVPLDGSAPSEAVLSEIRRFLRMEDSEVVLARATEILAVDAYPGIFEKALEQARGYLADHQKRLTDQGVRTSMIAEFGRPADFILQTAVKEHATLIALATHGRKGLTRALAGSVAEEVLRRSPVPVFAVRPSPIPVGVPREPGPIRTILVPLDGSDRSLKAMEPANAIAETFGARLILLYVRVPGSEAPPKPEEYLETAAQLAKGPPPLRLVESGDPIKEILGTSRFHQADLIAMSTHGRTGLKRLTAGSVTEAVLRQAYVPLLVVRSVEAEEKRAVA
jgi:nucleotide-binding universal stress UspA family protein